MSLQRVMQRHYGPLGVAGGKPRRATLLADLRQHYRVNVRLHVFVLLLLLGVLAAMFAFVLRHTPLENKDLATVIAAMAAFVGAGIEIVRRVTREWSQARLLQTVVQSMTEDQVAALIAKLIEPGKA